MKEKKQRLHLYICGRVQGVCFRALAREEAQRLGLTGWVKNLPDLSVELVAEGERVALDRMLVWARRGPPSAHVETMNVEWQEATGEQTSFVAK